MFGVKLYKIVAFEDIEKTAKFIIDEIVLPPDSEEMIF